MSRRTLRTIMLAAAALAVIAGVILAVTRPAHRITARSVGTHVGTLSSTDVNAAAAYLGLDSSKLRAELRSGGTLAAVAQSTPGRTTAGLAAALAAAKATHTREALKAGTLSAAAAQAQLSTVGARARAELQRRRPAAGLNGALAPAARYLHISRAELRAQTLAGDSLAEIAERRKGRSAAGLIAALVHARNAAITAAVSAGDLTHAEAAELRATLRRRMSKLAYGRAARRP